MFLKDRKLIDTLHLNDEENKHEIDWNNLYDNIDLAESISNITGKKIKKITKDYVILEGNVEIEFKNIPFELIKPLIWWD